MVRKLTVLQMLPALDGGGVERGTLEVAQALVEAGHRSLVMSAGGRMVDELLVAGSEHFQWPVDRKSLLTLRLIWRLRRFLTEQAVDVVHVRSRVPAWLAWLAWCGMDPATRPRFVTTVHGLYSVNAYSRIMTRGECVIAVSETVRGYILKNYPDVDTARIKVIPRGVDPDKFPSGFKPGEAWLTEWRKALPQLIGKRVLTLPGRLTRLKGHHDFIALVGELKAKGLNVHGLVVGGEDPHRKRYAEALYQLVREQGLDDDITFLGHRTDMREVFAVSDLVLSLSTRPESFGRTVLEALSLGRPVLGFGHGGVGEILQSLYPIGITQLGNRKQLFDKAEQLLSQPTSVMSAHSFDLSVMLSRTLSIYSRLARC